MHKETLSNYGWIVICTLVLAVMIALATPFGEFIRDGVWSTTNGLNDTLNKNMEIVGLNGSSGDNQQQSGIRFGEKYIVTECSYANMIMTAYYIFYEDGSATVYNGERIINAPAGSFEYTETEIKPTNDDSPAKILENGTKFTTDGLTAILESEIKGIRFGEKYIVTSAEDNDVLGLYYIFYEDGSATMGLGDEILDSAPAGFCTYTETEISLNGKTLKITENGTKLSVDDIVMTLESELSDKNGVYFNKKYVVTTHPDASWIGTYLIFYKDGGASQHRTDGTADYFPSNYFTYEETQIVYSGDHSVIVFEIIDDGNKIYTEIDGAAVIAVLES
jgi:hypothetical protein